MSTSNPVDRHRLALLAAALLFASAVCGLLLGARVAYTRSSGYVFLAKNLVLAWLPLLCALGAGAAAAARPRVPALLAWVAGWLVFFPNAPYLLTDLVHLRARGNPLWWYDVVLLGFCAWTGLALGLASLLLVQRALAARWGAPPAFLLALAALALGAFGIQLGRFGRFNSWDVLARPGRLLAEVADILLAPRANLRELAFAAALALVLTAAYLVLLAFVRLGASDPRPGRQPA